MKMKQPIHLHLPAEVNSGIRNLRGRHPLSRYYVHYAPCQLIPLPESPIIRQGISHRIFHVQLLETEAANNFEINFSILYPCILAVFVREGDIAFYAANGDLVSHAKGDTYYMCYCNSAKFCAKVASGPQRLVVVSFDIGWLLSEMEHLSPLSAMFSVLESNDTDTLVLPHCTIGQSVYYHLEQIRTCLLPPFERGAEIVRLLSKCIGIYCNLLAADRHLLNQLNESRARTLKAYIAANYTSEELGSVAEIGIKIGISEYKIKELAAIVFGTSVHQHVIRLRMEKAMELLMSTNLMIKEVAFSVGYSDAGYFCNAFKKHYGFLPREVRKTSVDNC